jgi:hypothetical protein
MLMFNVSMRVPTMRMRMMGIFRITSVGGHPLMINLRTAASNRLF